MRRAIILLLAVLPLFAVANKQKKADAQTEQFRYELEPVSVGQPGTVVVKVWSFSKKPTIAQEQCKKNAVHGVIFKGVPAKDRIPGKRPLVEDSAKESEFADFFAQFFANGGDYMRFVTLTNSGAVSDVAKVAKGQYKYKVGLVVTVSYDELRKYLESKGVIRKLGSGF